MMPRQCVRNARRVAPRCQARARAAWPQMAGLAALGLVSLAAPAWAGSTGGADMPWNGPLDVVLSNLTGPTGRALAALMFVIGGAIWGFTRHEEGAKKFGQALFGIAVMLGAVQIVGVLAFAGAMV